MGGILSTGGAQADGTPKIAGVQIQTSVAGKCIPLVFGEARLAPNLLDYGDFVTKKAAQSGGKGGVLATGKNSPGAPTYQAAVIMGICAGPIAGIGAVYADKNVTTLSALGLTLFVGGPGQNAWGYMTAAHPTEARAYRRTAYVAGAAYQLGNSGALPNHSFEVRGIGWGGAVVGIPDAGPDDVVTFLLEDAVDGAGFPLPIDLATYGDYVLAASLFISPVYDSQRPAAEILAEIVKATNSEFVVTTSDNVTAKLRIVPYGDEVLTGNGRTYTPPAAPLFDLGPADFIPGEGEPPVVVNRKRPSDRVNLVRREYLNRAARYAPANISAPDAAAIQAYGRREDPSQGAHLFAVAGYARHSAQLALQRQQVRNTYRFPLDCRYDCLDPMDLVTLTEPSQNLDRVWVRIVSIDEEDFVLTVEAEEYLGGTGAAALYDIDTGDGFDADYNAAPDPAITPVIFEPPQGLVTGLEVWIGTAGSGANWGGADVWLSTDGTTYAFAGAITAAATIGALTAVLPAVVADVLGQTIDVADTLSVDLSQSLGELTTTSQQNALALNTLCWVDGELLAFADANLTGPNAYDLSFLVRGAYDAGLIAAHAIGSRFMRLDASVLKVAITADRIGQTVYVKLLSRNVYGGGQEQLADVSAYAFTVAGNSISAPLPNVVNFRTVFRDGNLWLYWDEVTDPRAVLYEVRKGASWESGQFLTRLAHPPVPSFGDDTYWVAAFAQPDPATIAYSPVPAGLSLAGSIILRNVLAVYDEPAGGWAGTLSAGLEVSGGNLRTKLGQTGGTYEVGAGHIVNQGRNAAMAVWIDWSIIGQYWNADFLGQTDFLGQADFLGASATALVNGFPEIAISNDGATFGPWLKYAPGTYLAWKVKGRMVLSAPDARAAAYCTKFKLTYDPQDRRDFIANQATSAGADTTINFRPNGAGADAAFNGGPGGTSVPALTWSIRDLVAGDDLVIVALALSALTFKVVNAGARVVRHVDLLAQGY